MFKIKIFFISAVFLALNSATVMAKPEVFFSDSSEYQDVYLIHTFEGDNIKFKMSNDAITNIVIPTRGYNFDALVNFTKHVYEFANPALKKDFEKMFGMSFTSRYKTNEFLVELARLLRTFTERYPKHVH